MHQIFQVLLNSYKSKIIFFSLFFFLTCTSSQANEVFTIVKVNRSTITNVDLNNEKKILFFLNKNVEIQNIQNIALQNLINKKIKLLETQKNGISVNEQELIKNLNSYFDKILENGKNDNERINKNINEIKFLIKNDLKIQMSWSKLIKEKFIGQINININEIEYFANQKKLNNNEIENLINSEKLKKLKSYESSYFNEIKKKYLINFNK